MPKLDFKVMAVTTVLENGCFLTEAPLLPSVVCFGQKLQRNLVRLRISAVQALEGADARDIWRYQMAGEMEVRQADVEIEPSKRWAGWNDPLRMTFPYVTWMHGDETAVAYVPELGIQVLAGDMDELKARVPAHIRFAIMRERQAGSLGRLAILQRARELLAHAFAVQADIRSPKQVVEAGDERAKRTGQTIKILQGGPLRDLSSESLPCAYEVDDAVARIAEALKASRRRSLLLVGPSGVGKTAALYELIRRRRQDLPARAFWGTSGSNLVAGMSGFGMWQERCREICREAAAKNAVLHVGGLVELMEVGKSIHNTVSIASFLRPYVVRGEVVLVAECTPAELPVIERLDPHLLQAFHQLRFEEPTPEKGHAILLSETIAASTGARLAVDESALAALDRLHRRFAGYSAYPGRPLRFLQGLLRDRAPNTPVSVSDVNAAFARETGMPMVMVDENMPMDGAAVHDWFTERVKGQEEAVQRVVDVLAVAKTRLGRPQKPLAVLLFAGPTGVGKTEMAKALAEYLFGDRRRTVRFDMSEFGDPAAALRLIGGGNAGEGLLTARIREQPFAVLLLDEFEKAHPAVFDLLLQVFGEGRLTDMAGRTALFQNAVIIMTSNLGAQSFQKSAMGFAEDGDVRTQAAEHFTGEVRKFMRPELFNRLDAIVPFAPLDRAMIRAIAEREIQGVLRREGIRMRRLRCNVAEGVAELLAETGFDPRYGARPLKRAIERNMVTKAACALNAYSDEVALDLGIVRAQEEILVEAGAQSHVAASEKDTVEDLAVRCRQLRRQLSILKNGIELNDIENEIFCLERMERKYAAGKTRHALPTEDMVRLAKLREIVCRVAAIAGRVVAAEDRLLLGLYEAGIAPVAEVRALLAGVRQDLDAALLDIYILRFSQPDRILLGVYGDSAGSMFTLARAYCSIVRELPGGRVSALRFKVVHATSGRRALKKEEVEEVEKFLKTPAQDVVGVLMEMTGPNVHARLCQEFGWHRFSAKGSKSQCFVHVSDASVEKYLPPSGAEKPGGILSTVRRRDYPEPPGMVTDYRLDKKVVWDGSVEWVVAKLVTECLERETRGLVAGGEPP